jgi:hypothetical protein
MKTGLLLNFIIELPAVSIVHVHKKSGADFCSQDLEKLGTIPWHWQLASSILHGNYATANGYLICV